MTPDQIFVKCADDLNKQFSEFDRKFNLLVVKTKAAAKKHKNSLKKKENQDTENYI
jgi:hypothetical protein